jgi:hypothetical protein
MHFFNSAKESPEGHVFKTLKLRDTIHLVIPFPGSSTTARLGCHRTCPTTNFIEVHGQLLVGNGFNSINRSKVAVVRDPMTYGNVLVMGQV